MKQTNTEPASKTTRRWGTAIIIILLLSMISLISSVIIGFFIATADVEESGNVAHIMIVGPIVSSGTSGFMSEDVADTTELVRLIKKASDNTEIKAILLEINSPGGTAVASYDLAQAIKKSNKTTVAWIRELGASGAYWAASATDHIVANPLSITGSIGVIASYIDFSGTLNRYNASYQRLVAGDYKDMGTPLRKMTTDEEKIMQESLDMMRDTFVEAVAKNRKMPKEDIERMADGRFYLGKKAFDLGLVDELGGKEEAIKWIEKKENMTAEVAEYKKPKTLAEVLTGVFSYQSFSVGQGIGKSMLDAKLTRGVELTT